MQIHSKRDRKHNHFHQQLCPDHSVQSHQCIHENQQRNIQKPLAAEGQNRRLGSFSHGLKRVADQKIHRRQRHCQAGDPQEAGAQGAGLRLRNEQMHDGLGKGRETGHKTGGHDEGCFPGKEGYRPHPFIIPRRVVIAHQRHKALAQPHGHIQGELIDPLDNSIGRHRDISVTGGQPDNHHVGGISQRSGQGRGQSHGENLSYKPEGKVPGKQ